MKILLKLTSRSRPEKLIETIKNVLEMADDKARLFILVSMDFDDTACNNAEFQIALWGLLVFYGEFHYGHSKNKIQAINADMDKLIDFDILINHSDDMRFTIKGFDNIIRQNMPADLDAFLHFPDVNHSDARSLCTLSIMGRKYYERFGYIYHSDYESVYCDDEATEVAKRLGKHRFVNKVIFLHKHPAYHADVVRDAQYQKTESSAVHQKDRRTFIRRKTKNFYLPK